MVNTEFSVIAKYVLLESESNTFFAFLCASNYRNKVRKSERMAIFFFPLKNLTLQCFLKQELLHLWM